MARVKIVDQNSFDFGGHTFYYQLKEMDGDALDQIRGYAEGLIPNHNTARAIAIRRTVHKLVMDGNELSLKTKDDGTTNFPKVYDLEAKETLSDPLLRFIVKTEPQLPVLMEDTFGKYVEENPTKASPIVSLPNIEE